MTTQAEIDQYNALEQELYDTGDALATKDPTQLEKYVTALTRAIALRPSVSSRGSQGDEIRYSLVDLRELLKVAMDVQNSVARKASAGFIRRPLERYC